MTLATPAWAGLRSTPEGVAPAPALGPGGEARSQDLYLKLIGDLRQTGRAHAALAHLDQYDQQHPRDPRSTLLRAGCLTDIGDYAQADRLYKALRRTRMAGEAEAGLGRIAALQSRWGDAAQAYAAAVATQPISVSYLSDLGYVLLRAGDPAGAAFRLRQAVELEPDDHRARNNLILALEAGGQADEAKALRIKVSDPVDRQALAEGRRTIGLPQPVELVHAAAPQIAAAPPAKPMSGETAAAAPGVNAEATAAEPAKAKRPAHKAAAKRSAHRKKKGRA